MDTVQIIENNENVQEVVETKLNLANEASFSEDSVSKMNRLLAMTPEKLYEENPVVTYDHNGEPKDYFRDNCWNYNGYKDVNTNRVNAAYNATFRNLKRINSSLLNQLKMIVFHYFHKNYPLTNNARCAQSICENLSRIYKYLDTKNQTTVFYLSDNIHLLGMLENIGSKYAQITLRNTLYSLNNIIDLSIPNLDFSLNVDRGRLLSSNPENSIQQLSEKYCRKDGKEPEQTLWIPSGVHEEMINSAFDMLVEAEKRIDDICNYFTEHFAVHELSEQLERSEDEHSLRTDKKQRERRSSIRRTPSKEYRKQGIVTRADLLKKYSLKEIDDKYAGTGKGILYYTNIIAASCFVLIGSFSGMREDEVLALKPESFGYVGTKKRTIFFLRSYETKISGGQYVDYVTSPIVKRAIELMNKLHSPARKLIPELANKQFLFFSYPINRLPMYGEYGLAETLPKFMKHFDIRVSAVDIEKHKVLNKNNTKVINIGDIWPIATHQFRRTLIVNFLNHDVVGITEMKQQVKHMYASMTEYYGENVDLAKTLKLERSKLFVKIIGEEKVELNVALYKRFYQSEEHLEGKKGEEIERQRGLAKVLTDDEIRLLVETGGFRVTWTMFGYCTKGDLCDKSHIVDPTFCGAKCETMVITIENAKEWRKLYQRNKALIKGVLLDGFKNAMTVMKAQNAVAVKIMNSFNLIYEV